ncbi:MAG TPA: hypothetical protein VFW33_19550 [Gemmataceae bacterium]|nr:hypothetical protein [Gemmataceae bacterium]
MFNFSPGHFAPVAWQRTGGVLGVLNIKQHDLKISVLLHDVTSTGSLGVRARLAGPTDVAGQVTCDLDLDAPPYLDPPLMLPGISGVAAFGMSIARSIQVPLIVEQLHFASAIDSEVKWDTDMKCNSRAGLIVYPAL